MPPTVVGPAQTAPLVEPARYELDGLNVKHVSPVRLVYEHTSEHRLSLDARFEELKNLLDLVADDGVEDHGVRIRRRRREIFGLLGGRLHSFVGARGHAP
jgi:hypothetical protein